jgi:hypothetical protein
LESPGQTHEGGDTTSLDELESRRGWVVFAAVVMFSALMIALAVFVVYGLASSPSEN